MKNTMLISVGVLILITAKAYKKARPDEGANNQPSDLPQESPEQFLQILTSSTGNTDREWRLYLN